jgi:hypothetical protein
MAVDYKMSDFNSELQPSGEIGFDAGGRGTTSSPGYIKLEDTDGTGRFLFPDTDGRLRLHTSIPTANSDGVVVADYFDDAVTATSTVAAYTLGTIRQSAGKFYKYVKNIDLTAANGWALCAGSASDPTIVSGDATGGSSINSVPIGVAVGAIPQNSYAWILVHGYHSSVISDGSVVAGESLVKHATTDGGVDSAASGSTVVITVHQSFGLALANDTTSRVKAHIRCL